MRDWNDKTFYDHLNKQNIDMIDVFPLVQPAAPTLMSSEFKTTVDACSICLENLVNNTRALRCGHVFHNKCIGEYLSYSNMCPNCRTII